MTGFGQAVDAALEACVVPGFSRIGLAVRSRLLPEFTAGEPPAIDGKAVIITGATSGIGYAAASPWPGGARRSTSSARGRDRAERARRGIAAESGSTRISYGLADMEDLDAVRDFARQFNASHDRLDVLIHNAGAIHPQFRADAAGTELTVLGQVIAPFLLTRLLMPALLAAAPSRVITVSSGGMYTQRLDLATLQMPRSRYRGATAYAKAKRAQVALSREWARRMAGTGVAFHAMHPGWVNTPGCGRRAAGLLPGHPADPAHTASKEPTPSSGSPPCLPSGWAAAGSGTTGARGPNTRCRGHASTTPPPRELWDHLAAATATGAPKLAQAGPDGVAADHDIPAQGRDDRAAAI